MLCYDLCFLSVIDVSFFLCFFIDSIDSIAILQVKDQPNGDLLD